MSMNSRIFRGFWISAVISALCCFGIGLWLKPPPEIIISVYIVLVVVEGVIAMTAMCNNITRY